MKTPEFTNIYKKEIKEDIQKVLARKDCREMYNMMRYFFGWMDESFNEVDIYGGKQYRSVLCLSIAEIISGDYRKALPAATAVELFHNFTLIHDDIEDSDEFRRGRKTVWNVWGVPQAINTGDAQLILSIISLGRLRETGISAETILDMQEFMNDIFLQIIEGQNMDMSFTEVDIEAVSPENYLEMITKKTSVLVGGAAKVGAMCVTDDKKIQEDAYQFGLNFGIAYQVCDDLIGIWGTKEQTGKDELSDITEKKKTLPIIYAFSKGTSDIKNELKSIYNEKIVSESQAKRVVEILDELGAYEYVWQIVEEKRKEALEALNKIGKNESIKYWEEMMVSLTPDIKKEGNK